MPKRPPKPTVNASLIGVASLGAVTLGLYAILIIDVATPTAEPARRAAATPRYLTQVAYDESNDAWTTAGGSVQGGPSQAGSAVPRGISDTVQTAPRQADQRQRPAYRSRLSPTPPETPQPRLPATRDAGTGEGTPVAQPGASTTVSSAPSTAPQAQAGADAGAPPLEDAPPVQCGHVTCDDTEICCNESCGTCAPAGVYCDPRPCRIEPLAQGELCGNQSCARGSSCCCGTCVPPGGACDPDACVTVNELELTVPCGNSTLCRPGQVCCNPSCGICTEPGETCSQEICQ